MAGPGGAAQRTEKAKRGGLAGLVIGMVMGALGAVFLPGLAGPYLPDALRGDQVQVAGVVEAKATEGTRLLLTVGSEAGATLVTFRDEIAEIDLLVSVGDSVLLSVDEYAPFIDDAKISRVMKPRDWRAAPPVAVDTAAEPDTMVIDGIAVDSAAADTTTGAADTTTGAADTAPPVEAP
jgi:hypothetical protein